MHPVLIPWALAGGTAVTVGFARFGYALILPAMQTNLALNYTQAGWLNTSNALGYLIGSLLTLLLVNRLGNHRLFVAGLLITLLSLFANGLSSHLLLLNLIRFITGIASAWAFICGGVLASVLGARAIIIYFGGGGTGMLLTGASLPWLFELTGPHAWPWAWFSMAVLCTPLGLAAIAAARYSVEPVQTKKTLPWAWRACSKIFIAYFMFGMGYIAYMTFMVAWVRQNSSPDLPLAFTTSVMWSLLGLASLLAPTLWASFFHGRTNGLPMASAMATLAGGAILPLAMPGLISIWLSAFMVGASVFMVPSAVTGFVKSNLPAATWGSALAVATSLFALGQVIGPAAAGWISDLAHSLSFGLLISAIIIFSGALLALAQKSLNP